MPEALRRTIGRAVGAERVRLELSQAQLADRIGWDPSTIAQIETGRRPVRLDEIPELCAGLECTLPRLLVAADDHERAYYGLKPRREETGSVDGA